MDLKNDKQVGFLDWWILIPLSVLMYIIFHLFAYFFFNVLNSKLTPNSKSAVRLVGYILVILLMLISLISFF